MCLSTTCLSSVFVVCVIHVHNMLTWLHEIEVNNKLRPLYLNKTSFSSGCRSWAPHPDARRHQELSDPGPGSKQDRRSSLSGFISAPVQEAPSHQRLKPPRTQLTPTGHAFGTRIKDSTGQKVLYSNLKLAAPLKNEPLTCQNRPAGFSRARVGAAPN